MFPHEIFRSYDIRGTTDQLTEPLAEAVGRACVRVTKATTIVVGRDMRSTSPMLAAAVIRGIHAEGARVVDIGMCTTPMFTFAVSHFPEHEGGVMITASHNPAQYNGFKVSLGNAMPVSGEDLAPLVRELMAEANEANEVKGGEVISLDVRDEYLNTVFAHVGSFDFSGMKIVVDAGNGMAGVVLPKLFERLNATLIPMYFDPDGTFPNHEANPIKPETLTALVARMKEEGASVGVAFDGDADRVAFVDENGALVGGDQMLAFLASERLRDAPGGKVVWSPNASWAVRDAIAAAGGESVWERVGRTHLIRRVMQEGAVLGGEVSAHYFYPEFGGMESTEFTMLLVLQALARTGQSLATMMAPYRVYARAPEKNYHVQSIPNALAAIDQAFAGEAGNISRLDGARYEFGDWWLSVRASNTEPLVRVNVEAKSAHRLAEAEATIAKILENQ